MGFLAYLFGRLAYRFGVFFRHWYVSGTRRYSHAALNIFEFLDRGFAMRITLRHLFKPMYGDYSAVGYVLGFLFRTLRLAAGSVVYILVAAFIIFVYAFLALFPILFVASPFWIL